MLANMLHYYMFNLPTQFFMKTPLFLKVAAAALIFAACSSEENQNSDSGTFNAKSKEADGGAFAVLQDKARENLKETYYFDAGQDQVRIRARNGIEMIINTQDITVNGEPVQGKVAVEFTAITSRADMVMADMPPMGLTQIEGFEEPQLAPLFTGGQFLVEMTTEEGESIDDGSPVTISVPTELTGGQEGEGGSEGMISWEGEEDEEGNVTWDEKEGEDGNTIDVPVVDGRYLFEIFEGEWANIDKLDMIPGERTQIFVDVPDGFNNTNSSVYISYQGFANLLFELDAFDPSTGYFMNSYNNTPIGMTCNIIFVSQQNGQWLFGVHQVTIAGNDIITFTWGDLGTTNDPALIALLNSLP